jgi:two-component system nitrogen regulation response regulator GlnG
MKPVWIVDDDRSIRWVFEKALTREGIAFKAFASAQEAIDELEIASPQVLVSDIRMPGPSGLDLLQLVKKRYPALPVIIMTAYSDLESAVAAFQGGAFEYLPKPFDVDQAVELIRRALEESMREEQAAELVTSAPDMLGQAPAMQEVFRAIGRLAQSSATVLITGESGTGKELVARALHRHSPRASNPFVAINTAAMPKDLLESELFGHERGAFTGAQAMRRGRFEQAEGGTLFLDEIGDMPAELQTRLLRVLSDGTFYRVGGHQPLRASVRVIAATHQDLELRVKDGAFREDLFHRLNVIRLRLPALRERKEDVPALVETFVRRFNVEEGKSVVGASPETLACLCAFDWPGNVRQLENAVYRAIVLSDAPYLQPHDFPAISGVAPPAPAFEPATSSAAASFPAGVAMPDLPAAVPVRILDERGHLRTLEEIERDLIQLAIEIYAGHMSEVARRLGIGRSTLYRKVREQGLEDVIKGAGDDEHDDRETQVA